MFLISFKVLFSTSSPECSMKALSFCARANCSFCRKALEALLDWPRRLERRFLMNITDSCWSSSLVPLTMFSIVEDMIYSWRTCFLCSSVLLCAIVYNNFRAVCLMAKSVSSSIWFKSRIYSWRWFIISLKFGYYETFSTFSNKSVLSTVRDIRCICLSFDVRHLSRRSGVNSRDKSCF